MTLKKILINLTLLYSCLLQAQTIDLEFPYLAGKTYVFAIVQGSNHVEIKKDTIPPNGKVQLQVPDTYKNYKGMALWYLTNSKTGGGLDLVLNNEDFSVRCMDSIYTDTSIVYSNTKENSLLLASAKEQTPLLKQYGALTGALNAFSKDHPLYPSLIQEEARVANQYALYYARLKTNTLYASRFRVIDNLSRGIGSLLTQDYTKKTKDFDNIIVNEIDYTDLYTSNHWYNVWSSWFDLNTQLFKNDEQFIQKIKTILSKLPSAKIYTEFVELFTKHLTQKGQDRILRALSPTIKNSKKLVHTDGVLAIYQKDLTGKAPVFDVIDHRVKVEGKNWEHTTTLDFSQMKNKYSVLMFYQSDCGHCEAALDKLVNLYPTWKAKGVELYTISGDTDGKVFTAKAAQLPWKHKYCDYKGFDGPGFKAYAVVGTPAFYLLDKKGNIVPNVFTLSELEAWFKEKLN